MAQTTPRQIIATTVITSALLSPLALSHYDDKQVPQSYRQSLFTLLAMNFGPMGAMAKGEMPWDDKRLQAYARDLEAAAGLDLMRGFPPGSDKGTTRAKPEIWQNRADFESKLEDLRKAAAELNVAAKGGVKDNIMQKIGAAGKACKACHDEYKADEYLY